VRILGFGLERFRSPDVNKPVPPGTVKSGGTVRGCPQGHTLWVYLALDGFRKGMTFSLRWRDDFGGNPTFTYPYRFLDEVHNRPWYPPRIHAGYGLTTPYATHGHFDLTVVALSKVRARGSVTLVNTCG
jgi:hypothetical protein